MTKKEQAIRNFKSGMNCSQAVFLAFSSDFGIDETTAKMMTLGLGGGVGRMREVCGAVSAAAMVLGVAFGGDGTDKGTAYEKIQQFAHRFREQSGSIICAERLGLPREFSDPVPEKRTGEYYKRRPCSEICGDAARILEEMLSERKEEKNRGEKDEKEKDKQSSGDSDGAHCCCRSDADACHRVEQRRRQAGAKG